MSHFQSQVPGSSLPVVTLITDFGIRDFYVSAMKAVLVRHSPQVRLIDITHEVPRHDIPFGSITLERALASFDPGTIHLAVIDPGVGTSRRILIVKMHGQIVVCPDNGLITWAWRRLGAGHVYELTWKPAVSSSTFHGRDIMAPVAGLLVTGAAIAELARPIDDPILLDIHVAIAAHRKVSIIHIDQFGNATTNLPAEELVKLPGVNFSIRGHLLGPCRHSYSDVERGQPLALIGSSGLLEIAVREGSAQRQFNLHSGDAVELT